MTNLEMLASIGEFVGGFAVLVSLIVLVVNVRRNTSQVQENTLQLKRVEMRHTYEQHDRYRLATMDRDVAELFARGLEGEKLDLADAIRFGNMMTMVLYSMQNNWDAIENGLMTRDEWKRSAPALVGIFGMPGGRKWWRRSRSVFIPGFVEEVENMFADQLAAD